MKILVCGSRHFNDYALLNSELNEIVFKDRYDSITIISGEARGADTLAKEYAENYGYNYEGYPADWDTYGKRAGPIRNSKMLVEGKPDLVVAFLAKDSRGTKHMISIAEKAGIPVKVVNVG